MSRSEDVRPPERALGARVRIKAVHQAEVETLFDGSGFAPIYKDERTDGAVSYWFGKEQAGSLFASGVLDCIPLSWWTVRAVAGQPPIID